MDVRSGRDCGMHPSDLLLILVTQNAQEIIKSGEGKDWVGARTWYATKTASLACVSLRFGGLVSYMV